MRRSRRLLFNKRAIVGIEAAIVLIAFVIIAAAFAFMAINMGLFATQRSKDTIAQGLRESSSPLQLDGNIFLRVNETNMRAEAIIIPLRAMGVKYVPMGANETVVSISISGQQKLGYANIYYGIDRTYDPKNKTFDELSNQANSTAKSFPHAVLLVENSDGDEALDASEKGFLMIGLGSSNAANPRDIITIEIRVEKSAPLTIEFVVPESLTASAWNMVVG